VPEGLSEHPEPRSTSTEQIWCPWGYRSNETTYLYTRRGLIASETFRCSPSLGVADRHWLRDRSCEATLLSSRFSSPARLHGW
jgi:hypothetical protein